MDYMRYNLLESKFIVMHWVKMHINKVVEEKMGSDTSIK